MYVGIKQLKKEIKSVEAIKNCKKNIRSGGGGG